MAVSDLQTIAGAEATAGGQMKRGGAGLHVASGWGLR